MSNTVQEQQNNPLHGLSLKSLISEIVGHYGWEILYAAMKMHCFKDNPSITSAVNFLKKTEWAREKVENFYLYRFKRMPRPSKEQFVLKPRERGFADGIEPKAPQELTFEIIEQIQQKAAQDFERHKHLKKPKRTSSRPKSGAEHSRRDSKPTPPLDGNPWGKRN